MQSSPGGTDGAGHANLCIEEAKLEDADSLGAACEGEDLEVTVALQRLQQRIADIPCASSNDQNGGRARESPEQGSLCSAPPRHVSAGSVAAPSESGHNLVKVDQGDADTPAQLRSELIHRREVATCTWVPQ